MKTALRIIDVGLARPLSIIGLNKPTLSIFDQMDANAITLRQLKRVIKIAKYSRDEQRLGRYIKLAMERFPSNTLGFVEYARHQMSAGNVNLALATLRRAPKSREVASVLADIQKLTDGDGIQDSDDAESKALLNQLTQLERGVFDAGKVVEFENYAKTAIRKNVSSWANYELLVRAWLLLKRNSSVIHLLKDLSKLVNRNLSYEFLLANAYLAERDQISALSSLLTAQRQYPRERRILFRIAEIYRDDGQITAAHIYMKAAQACYPIYGTVRCLTFEADHKLLNSAGVNLDIVSTFAPADLLKFMPMINRVSVFFPDRDQEIAMLREKARKELWVGPFRSSDHLNGKIEAAIKSRWISDASKLIAEAGNADATVDPALVDWLDRIVSSLGEMSELAEIAYINEQGDEIFGLVEGVPVPIDRDRLDVKNTIELFIPTAFFADREDEKPSYQTVRRFLRIVYAELLCRPGLIVVPRHQYNWRHCHRRLGGKAISYHTNALFDRSWLHVQEAPLAGRCSLDHQGFAGYSSLAYDFSDIVQKTELLTLAELRNNHREMYEKYVTANVSKYEQPEQRTKISGDYVFVALQIPTDIVADLAAVKGVEMLKVVAKFYDGTNVKVIVKRHPYCNSMSVQCAIKELIADGKIVESQHSVHDLIEGAQIVFTVNSGVGLEALIHLKPVVVTGECDYRYAVAAAPRTLEGLQSILQSGVRVDEEKILRFLHYYNTRYAIDINDKERIKSRLDAWLTN